MDEQFAMQHSKEERASFSNIPEDVIPSVVEVVRSWAEKEDVGEDWKEKRA